MSFCKAENAWKRGLRKHRPSQNLNLSAIKPIECVLTPIIEQYEDSEHDKKKLEGFAWVVSMTEQYYYDNALMMLNKYSNRNPDLICRILRANSMINQGEKFPGDWIKIVLIGFGAFGKVFKLTEKSTKCEYALKYVFQKEDEDMEDNFEFLLTYLSERNYLIKARNSPFIVNFYTSFKYPNLYGNFLLFELCPTDLTNLLRLFARFKDLNITKAAFLKDGSFNLVNEHEIIMNKLKIKDIGMIQTVYLLECLCILDYLIKMNLIHCDIKPSNILMSRDLHLKLTDFGLVYNTSFVGSQNYSTLMNPVNFNWLDTNPRKRYLGGTANFFDMELLVKHVSIKFPQSLEEVRGLLYKNIGKYPMGFESDLWAMGKTMLNILLLGNDIFNPGYVPNVVKQKFNFPENDNKYVVLMHYFARKDVSERLVFEGLRHLFEETEFDDFIEFILTIFLPRQQRCQDFIKEKTVRFHDTKSVERCLDLSKVMSKVTLFRENKLTPENVFLYTMPKELLNLVKTNVDNNQKTGPKFSNFKFLVKNLLKLQNQETESLNFCPAQNIVLL